MEKEEKQEDETQKQEPNMVLSANAAAERLKAENERMEKNIAAMQELKAYEALGGLSKGKEQEVKPVDIDPTDYAKLALAGKIQAK
jgi:hypothetical protein